MARVVQVSVILVCLSSKNRMDMWCAGEWSVTAKIPLLTSFAVLSVTQGSAVNVYIRVGRFPTTVEIPGYRTVSSAAVWWGSWVQQQRQEEKTRQDILICE